MAGKTKEQNDYEFELDINDLREQLGIDEILKEQRAIREMLSEWLSYVNLLDISVQELLGEPSVTERIQYNIPKGGRLEVQRHRPPIPANLAREKPQMIPKPKED